MRVVHVVVAGEIGGAERMLVDLASGQPGHALALLTPNEDLARMFVESGLRVHRREAVREGPLHYLAQSLGPRDVAWIEGVLRAERAQVAHLHTFGSQVVGTRAARQAGVAVVRTEHSTRVYDDATCWPFSRWSLRRADGSVAVSGHVQARALARAPWAKPRMQVIYNGVQTERFVRVDAVHGPFRFALVGRLEPRKGVDLALDALASVPGAVLDIVGDGPARASLWKHARARGIEDRVVFHGHLADPRPVVALASAALGSSRSEGLGISLLEAMAMGKPVVAFAVGGVAEVVKDGRTGLLARAGDPGALAARMREAMDAGPRLEAWGSAARARVLEKFSVTGMRASYDEVYARVVRMVEQRSS
jgi:glycosyltransferase involved in cell wall biosynthesis